MRLGGSVRSLAFFAQGESLADPEAVLLVDDRQTQFGKRDALLKQRVGADGELGNS